MRFSLSGPVKDKKHVKKYLQNRILDHYAKFGYGLYAVIHKSDQRFIGFTGLINQNIDDEEYVELGYRLNPNYWGKGLATEAARAVCDYAFNQLSLDPLISIIRYSKYPQSCFGKTSRNGYWKESTLPWFKVLSIKNFSACNG